MYVYVRQYSSWLDVGVQIGKKKKVEVEVETKALNKSKRAVWVGKHYIYSRQRIVAFRRTFGDNLVVQKRGNETVIMKWAGHGQLEDPCLFTHHQWAHAR